MPATRSPDGPCPPALYFGATSGADAAHRSLLLISHVKEPFKFTIYDLRFTHVRDAGCGMRHTA
jgi:hypothetical protein